MSIVFYFSYNRIGECDVKKIILDIDPSTFTGSAFLVGFLLIKDLTPNEQDSIGNWLELVGLVMQTYASQVTTIEANRNRDSKSSSDSDVDTIKKAMDKIICELDKIKKSSSN